MGKYRVLTKIIPAVLGALLIAGCATTKDDAEAAKANDPFETPNRFIFAFNRTLDTFILRPVAVVYRDLVPKPVQDGTHNVLQNVNEPITAINQVLQGDPGRAGTSLARFVINSTIGILGIFDVAKTMGLNPTREDFGQTLGVWLKDYHGGPYLVLPVLGPSNPRDSIGLVVDYFIDPFNIAARRWDFEYLMYVRSALEGVDNRARTLTALDDIEKNSLDYYTAIREAYRQRRAAEIKNETTKGTLPTPISSASLRGDDADVQLAR